LHSIYYIHAIYNYYCEYKLFYKMFNSLTTFNLSGEFDPSKLSLNNFRSEEFAS